MSLPIVIYHANCTDGFGAAWAAWKKLGPDAHYIAASYGKDSFIKFLEQMPGGAVNGHDVYVLDFSFPKPDMDFLFSNARRVVWLDHHKTAFESWGLNVDKDPNCRLRLQNGDIWLDNNQSGALLAWRFFHPEYRGDIDVPSLIWNIDDWDRWQFNHLHTREVHHALQSRDGALPTQLLSSVVPFMQFTPPPTRKGKNEAED